jgi:Alpha/beta hydrolase domain
MAVLDQELVECSPFAEGRSFGPVGPYEMLRGRTTVSIDPHHTVNRSIVDLPRARRAPSGAVLAQSDVLMLRPATAGHGNGCLLCVVPNRGTTGGMPFRYDEPVRFGPESGLDPGDGWLLRSGWTVVWIGWQCDIPRDVGLGCSVPEVVDADGRPLEGPIRVQLQPFLSPAASLPLRSATDLSSTTTCYPVAGSGGSEAQLLVAPGYGQPFEEVSPSRWRFACARPDGTLAPDRASVWQEGGFQPDKVYEVHYRTDRCPLVGAGLAVFRDVARHCIVSDDSLDHAFAVGWSQAGRFLRQYLRDGFNCDEHGDQVFDAVLPMIAGSQTGQFNQRYGQPSEPLTPEVSSAPLDLSAIDRSRGTAPKLVSVNTASEYWRGDRSFDSMCVDRHDVPDGDLTTREYYFAGAEHLGGAGTPGGQWPPRNHLLTTPLYRAVLELTRRWVVEGDPPPASRRPRAHDGTAVSRTEAPRLFGEMTGLAAPSETDLVSLESPSGAKSRSRNTSVIWVSGLDQDANEVAGIRHPELAVPLATHTGWNLIASEGPQWATFASITGNSVPFPPSHDPSGPSKDRRRSISARYRGIREFLSRLEASAAELAAEGFLLTEDIERVVATGLAHFESLARIGEDFPTTAPGQVHANAEVPRSNHRSTN